MMADPAAHTQVRTETRASGNYSASVRVITASYGGFGGDPAWKLRILLVRVDRQIFTLGTAAEPSARHLEGHCIG